MHRSPEREQSCADSLGTLPRAPVLTFTHPPRGSPIRDPHEHLFNNPSSLIDSFKSYPSCHLFLSAPIRDKSLFTALSRPSTRALPTLRWRCRLTPLRSVAPCPARLRGNPRGHRRHVLPSRAAWPRVPHAFPGAEDARPGRGKEITTPHPP